MIQLLANAFVAGVVTLSGGHALAAAGDQGHIDNALSASSVRLLETGFWSVGPGTRDIDFVSTCLGGLDSPGRLAPFLGETARAVSNVYLFQPDATADPNIGELFTMSIIAVDKANERSLEWFVLLLGSAESADCRRTEYLSNPAVGSEPSDLAPTVDAVATPDLGIGSGSSRLDMHIVFTSAGVQHRVAYSYLVTRTERELVALRIASFGDGPFSGIDAEAELAATVESLNTP